MTRCRPRPQSQGQGKPLAGQPSRLPTFGVPATVALFGVPMPPLLLNMLVGSSLQFNRPTATVLAMNGLLASSDWPLEIDDAQALVSLAHFPFPTDAKIDLLNEEGEVLASSTVRIAPRFKPSALARVVLRFPFEPFTLPGPTDITAVLSVGGTFVAAQVWRVLAGDPHQFIDGRVHVLDPVQSPSSSS